VKKVGFSDKGVLMCNSLADLYMILSDPDFIEQDEAGGPVSLLPDDCVILSERRVIAESKPWDYFNTLARSQEEANRRMIRYYAALQIDMRRDYRHFYVVHTEPKAPYVQNWKDELQTIADVISPEKMVEELKKESKESLFDFRERFMVA
jgi:chromo domain-containing protein 1